MSDRIDWHLDLGSASKNANIYGKRVLYLKRHPAYDCQITEREVPCSKSHSRNSSAGCLRMVEYNWGVDSSDMCRYQPPFSLEDAANSYRCLQS